MFLLIIKMTYFLRKVISNVKSNKISFIQSYKITKTEVDWKPPSRTEMKKYVTEYIKTKELHKNLGYIINETTLEEDTSLSKNSEAIEKSVESPNSNNIVSTTTSTSCIKVSKKEVLNRQKVY